MLKSTSNNQIENTDAASSCVATTSTPITHPNSLSLPSTTTTSTGNIISLVSLGSPQKSTKLFPWNSTNGNQVQTLNSPTKTVSSSSDVNLALSPLNGSSNVNASSSNNKQIIRPQLMIGNNNRINITSLNRPLNDSIHVLLKKPSNQTILIVSKPQSQSTTNTTNPTSATNLSLNSNQAPSITTPQQFTSSSNNEIQMKDSNKINNILMSMNNSTNNNNSILTNPFLSQLNNKKTRLINDDNNNNLPISYNDNEKPSKSINNPTNLPIINRIFDSTSTNNSSDHNNNNTNNTNLLNQKPIKLIPIKKINQMGPMNITNTATVKTASPSNTINSILTNHDKNATKDETMTNSTSSLNESNTNTSIINSSTQSNRIINEIQDNLVTKIDLQQVDETSNKLDNVSNNDNIMIDNKSTKQTNESNTKITNNKNTKTNSKQVKGDITRCICEMDHDDGFMICCDKCL